MQAILRSGYEGYVGHEFSPKGDPIEAWSDGNPYYIDDAGDKQYAYHPDHEKRIRRIRGIMVSLVVLVQGILTVP